MYFHMFRELSMNDCHQPEMRVRFLRRAFSNFMSSALMTGVLFLLLLSLYACAGKSPVPTPLPKAEISPIRFTIQVGAFSTVGNAIRLTRSLENQKLSAYYYRHKSGLFKVRFGDFATREEALTRAQALVSSGIIEVYYIVSPDEYPTAKSGYLDRATLRINLVETAENYIGIPYQWGGTSPDEGFDCSGLVMAVYQLNGFTLPRCSYTQYAVGVPVERCDLEKGDLVFFADSPSERISHVGMYTGDNTFIHAPRKGKTIRKDSLSNSYFASRFAGARSFIR